MDLDGLEVWCWCVEMESDKVGAVSSSRATAYRVGLLGSPTTWALISVSSAMRNRFCPRMASKRNASASPISSAASTRASWTAFSSRISFRSPRVSSAFIASTHPAWGRRAIGHGPGSERELLVARDAGYVAGHLLGEVSVCIGVVCLRC